MFKKVILIVSLMSFLGASEYQDWLDSQNKEYTAYKKSMDEEFTDMLKKDWEAFKAFSEPSPYEKPKPIIVPVVKKPIIVPPKEIKKSPIIKPVKIEKKVIKKPKIIVKKPKVIKNFKTANFTFYSTPIAIQYDKKTTFKMKKIDKKSISKFWDTISKTNFKKLLKQISKKSDELNLNDWAKYQLIHKLGNTIYKDNNKANLFTWFILVKMKYDTKVGYNSNKIYLLSTMQHSLYQVSFFTLKKKRYYILTPDGKVGNVGSIFTYAGDYPKAKNRLSFAIFKEMKFYNNLKGKNLKFKYNGKNYSVDAQYSKDLINFYKTYPQSDYNIYFSTKNSTPLSNSILLKLTPLIKEKSEIEAVNLLLRFVQTSFKYKTDQKQFDYEKVMFPEETIFYPYSDCEDRSIMFSYLVKSLLNLDVVGVKYKDHLATAVAFSSKISGDNFRYKGKKYTISDPTYINANAGMTMPQYKNSKFEIISLR
ncbi:MAG: hypothetical protein U9N59_08415 [Campylobacterota bacterium]|nr:hypothetical protein [Campylobacterota bacterium]